MLQDMKVELEKEAAEDKEVYDMLTCWCDTNEKEKTKAIELGTARIAQLESSLSENGAKVVELKGKLASATDEYNKDWAALNTAKELRMKETRAFHESEVELMQ